MTSLDPIETGLPTTVLASIMEVLNRHPNIEQAIIYGSRAMGKYRPGSDIDLTLKGTLSYGELLVIETELDDLMLPYKIDLSLYSQLDNPDLIDHIQRVGKELFQRSVAGP